MSSYAADLATVLDDGENLRVLPMASYGAAGNIVDLLYLNNVDVAITYADVLDHFKATEKVPNIEQRLHYIIPMFQSEVHLLVRPEIKTIQDLAGKKVGLDTHGSGANHTGAIVFERLGVQVEQIALSNAVALEAMRNNELAGIVHLASKPNELLAKVDPNLGFHLLAIEYSDKFRDHYVPAEIASADYPTLVQKGSTIRTISVQAVLAVFNWPTDSDRHRRSARFVEALFDGFERLRSPPFQPGWKEMNLPAPSRLDPLCSGSADTQQGRGIVLRRTGRRARRGAAHGARRCRRAGAGQEAPATITSASLGSSGLDQARTGCRPRLSPCGRRGCPRSRY